MGTPTDKPTGPDDVLGREQIAMLAGELRGTTKHLGPAVKRMFGVAADDWVTNQLMTQENLFLCQECKTWKDTYGSRVGGGGLVCKPCAAERE